MIFDDDVKKDDMCNEHDDRIYSKKILRTIDKGLEIKIPTGHNLILHDGESINSFIGQLQNYCPKLICLVNGKYLKYYDKKANIPKNIRFEHKKDTGPVVEYYFKDCDDGSIYCVYGIDAAKIFYPQLNEYPMQNNKSYITIIDKGVKFLFPNVDHNVELITYNISQA